MPKKGQFQHFNWLSAQMDSILEAFLAWNIDTDAAGFLALAERTLLKECEENEEEVEERPSNEVSNWCGENEEFENEEDLFFIKDEEEIMEEEEEKEEDELVSYSVEFD